MNISYKNNVLGTIQLLKYPKISSHPLIVPIHNEARMTISFLEMFTCQHLADAQIIRLLATWRAKNARWFPAQFRVTLVGTRRWAKHQLLEAPDRVLFMIRLPAGICVGHVGLYRFDYARKMCEIDNIVRGRKSVPGLMYLAVRTMMHWAQDTLGITGFSLRVFSDNDKAIRLYTRLGFQIVRTIPLCRMIDNGVTRWEEQKGESGKALRYYLAMERNGAP